MRQFPDEIRESYGWRAGETNTIVVVMLDPDAVEACAWCLAGAAVHEGTETDLTLAATALARDLADMQGCHAAALLHTASGEAAAYLDAALGPAQFTAALHRLVTIRGQTDTILLKPADERL